MATERRGTPVKHSTTHSRLLARQRGWVPRRSAWSPATREARVSFFHSLAANVYMTWLSTFSIAAMMWGIQRLFPKGPVTVPSQMRALKFWVFAGLGTAIAITIYGYVGERLSPRPLLVLPLNSWLASRWVHW